MLGKEKCRALREIRQKIASDNNIELVTKDCSFQGECKGTCPKCEAELRYLEKQLEVRRSLGRTVTVAALAAGIAVGMSACDRGPYALEGDVPYSGPLEGEPVEVTPCPDDVSPQKSSNDVSIGDLEGEMEFIELEGDVCASDVIHD